MYTKNVFSALLIMSLSFLLIYGIYVGFFLRSARVIT